MDKENNGLIVFFTGPMFSGKSERLLETINCLYTKSNNKITENDILAIKPKLDERDKNYIKSRNKNLNPIQCVQDEKLNLGLLLKNNNKKIIVIDEVQFFQNEQEDLQNILLELQKAGKIVLIAGLDRISNGKTWKLYDAIKSLEDKNKDEDKDNVVIIHGKAICDITGLEAEYSAKVAIGEGITKTDIQMQGDNKIEYYPICKEYFDLQEIIEKEYNEYYQQGVKNHQEIMISLRKCRNTFNTYEQNRTETIDKITAEGKEIVNNVVKSIIIRLGLELELSDDYSNTASNKEKQSYNIELMRKLNKCKSEMTEVENSFYYNTPLSSSEQSTYLFNNSVKRSLTL